MRIHLWCGCSICWQIKPRVIEFALEEILYGESSAERVLLFVPGSRIGHHKRTGVAPEETETAGGIHEPFAIVQFVRLPGRLVHEPLPPGLPSCQSSPVGLQTGEPLQRAEIVQSPDGDQIQRHSRLAEPGKGGPDVRIGAIREEFPAERRPGPHHPQKAQVRQNEQLRQGRSGGSEGGDHEQQHRSDSETRGGGESSGAPQGRIGGAKYHQLAQVQFGDRTVDGHRRQRFGDFGQAVERHGEDRRDAERGGGRGEGAGVGGVQGAAEGEREVDKGVSQQGGEDQGVGGKDRGVGAATRGAEGGGGGGGGGCDGDGGESDMQRGGQRR